MSLVIVVGGLEPTKDGIGDHSRRLAGALIKRGLPTSILALSDTLVAEARRERQQDDGVDIETFRVPGRLAFNERVVHGRRFMDETGGRHALFAFAPYQFDIRGVVSRALIELPDMMRGLTSSFLFHETWIGEQENSGLWTRLVGFTQRRLIQMLVHDLKPLKVYTTNGLYRRMLEAYDISTTLLPHPGNVPVQESRADWLAEALVQGGVGLGPGGLSNVYMIGLFGSLYDNLELPRLLPIFDTVARRKSRRPLIASIGIMGGNRQEWEHWRRVYGGDYGLVDLGPDTTLRISQFINSLDLAVATTSLPQVGKSGTAAAFLEHGIPVLVPTEQPYFRHWRESMMNEFPANCFRLTPDISDRLCAAERVPPMPRLPALADKLYAELRSYAS